MKAIREVCQLTERFDGFDRWWSWGEVKGHGVYHLA